MIMPGPQSAAAAEDSSSATKLAAGVGMAGALCAGVGNLLHPVTPRTDPVGVARVVAESDHWTLVHLLILAGIVAMVGGLFAIRLATKGGRGEVLADLGMCSAIMGATLGVATVILDGVAAKVLADQWAAAAQDARPVALAVFLANETLNFALAGAFNLSFAGTTFVLFGVAVARSPKFRSGLGWIGTGAGIISIAAGFYQGWSGRPTTASLVLTIIGPTVISLWLLVVCLLLVRAGPRPMPNPIAD
jgi:hypothetical protein